MSTSVCMVEKNTHTSDATMQVLSDIYGRVLIIEPRLAYREEQGRYSLVTNYSLINPESIKNYIVLGDNTLQLLERYINNFSISDALVILHTVRQKGV